MEAEGGGWAGRQADRSGRGASRQADRSGRGAGGQADSMDSGRGQTDRLTGLQLCPPPKGPRALTQHPIEAIVTELLEEPLNVGACDMSSEAAAAAAAAATVGSEAGLLVERHPTCRPCHLSPVHHSPSSPPSPSPSSPGIPCHLPSIPPSPSPPLSPGRPCSALKQRLVSSHMTAPPTCDGCNEIHGALHMAAPSTTCNARASTFSSLSSRAFPSLALPPPPIRPSPPHLSCRDTTLFLGDLLGLTLRYGVMCSVDTLSVDMGRTVCNLVQIYPSQGHSQRVDTQVWTDLQLRQVQLR